MWNQELIVFIDIWCILTLSHIWILRVDDARPRDIIRMLMILWLIQMVLHLIIVWMPDVSILIVCLSIAVD